MLRRCSATRTAQARRATARVDAGAGGRRRCRRPRRATQRALAPRATANRFDGPRAFALLREQVEDYGWRPAGSRRAAPARGAAARAAAARALRGRSPAIPGCATSSARARAGCRRSSSARTTTSRPSRRASSAPTTAPRARRPSSRSRARSPRRRAPRERAGAALRALRRRGGAGRLRRTSSPAGCAARRRTPSATPARRAALVLLDYIAEKHGPALPARGRLGPGAVGAAAQRRRAPPASARCSRAQTSGEILDDHTPFTQRGVPRDRPHRLRLPAARLARRQPRRGLASAASTPSARRSSGSSPALRAALIDALAVAARRAAYTASI